MPHKKFSATQTPTEIDLQDFLLFFDIDETVAGNKIKRITTENLLKAFNGLTELTERAAGDFLPVFDASAGNAKKIKTEKLVPAKLITDYANNDLAAAIAAIGSTETTLIINQAPATLTADVTFPSTLHVIQRKGCVIDGAYTLTINGPYNAGRYQGFDPDSVTVYFGSGSVNAVYPQWWGAKGDGVTNCTPGIQSAVDSLQSGGIVFLLPGDYRLFTEVVLNLSMPITIEGSGRQVTYVVLVAASQNGFNITMDHAVTMDGFTLTSSVTKIAGAGIKVDGKTGGTWNAGSNFRNMTIGDQYDGISFVDSAMFKLEKTYFLSNNNKAVNVRNSVNADVGDSIIDNCDFNSALATSAAVYYESSGGLRVVNNKFWDHNSGIILNLIDGNTGGLMVMNNSFDTQTNYGILLQHTAAFTFAGVVIVGNMFTGNGGVDIGQGGDDWLSEITISGNTFMTPIVRTCIELNGASNGVISGNTFFGQGGASIAITLGPDCDGIRVPPTNQFNNITTRVNNISTTSIFEMDATSVWDPANLVDGAGETSGDIAVTGAALGDFVLVAAPYDLQGITCNGYVQSTDKVHIRLQNETGGAIDLASGTWKVKVIKN